MARKKGAHKKFSAVKAVKENARRRVGQPKPERVIAEKSNVRRKPKHPPTLSDWLADDEPR